MTERPVLDAHALMTGLAEHRRVFHSEADFQHALAWRIQLEHPTALIRLETRPERGVRLDLLIAIDGHRTAIELKYLAARFTGVVDGEEFDLPNQGAHDISRHDVCKDVARVERMIDAGYVEDGWVIVLSNDGGYWRPGTKPAPIDAQFRIHEGRTLGGTLGWASTAGAGTIRKRDLQLLLRGRYECQWRNYSSIPREAAKDTSFRYLALHVERSPAVPTEPDQIL